MKGRYDKNGCKKVYSSKLNKEIAWLHSDSCVIEECAPFRDITKDIEEAILEDDVEHLKLECFFENGRIRWLKLVQEMKLNEFEAITSITDSKE